MNAKRENTMHNKQKVVLAGCGSISEVWLEATADFRDIEYVGFVDLNPERAASCRNKYAPDALTGTDLRKVLESTDPDIVFDCTVPRARYQVVTTALNFGCNVLGEKPLAESMEDAKKIVQTAQESGKVYTVIQNRRYDKNIIHFRKELKTEKIGILTALHADFFIGAHFDGFRNQMEHPLLIDMSIHTFDQARFITGKDPETVYAYEWNPRGSWYQHPASAVCIFEMNDGIVFTYRGSWCAEGLNTSWECDWRAIGDNGSIIWDGRDTIKGEVPVGPVNLIREKKELQLGEAAKLDFPGHAGVIRDFLDSLQNKTIPQTICSDNIKSLAMVHAAVKSAETGKKVKINI